MIFYPETEIPCLELFYKDSEVSQVRRAMRFIENIIKLNCFSCISHDICKSICNKESRILYPEMEWFRLETIILCSLIETNWFLDYQTKGLKI